MAKPKKNKTEPVSLPMLPLRGLMVFPHMVLHFDAGRKKSIAALDQAMEENQRIFLVAQRDMDVDDPAVDDIYHVGTIACVKQVLRLPGGNVRLLVEGKSRAVLRAVTQEEPFFVGALDEVLEQGTPVSIETDALLRTAIRLHNAYRLPEEMDDRTRMFCQILRDADKIDILRVNVETPMEQIYNVSTEALRQSPVSPAVLDAFYEHHCVLRTLNHYPADNAVGHASFVFELCYPESLRAVAEQGWLWKLLDFKTENPDTAKAFAGMKAEMQRWLEEHAK